MYVILFFGTFTVPKNALVSTGAFCVTGQRRPPPPPVRPRKGADRKRGAMSALTKAANTDTVKQCSVAKARAQLDPESAKDFDAWMAGELPMTDNDMWNALQGLHFRVGQQTVGRHRRSKGECGCRP